MRPQRSREEGARRKKHGEPRETSVGPIRSVIDFYANWGFAETREIPISYDYDGIMTALGSSARPRASLVVRRPAALKGFR
jgi:hypothetical protein